MTALPAIAARVSSALPCRPAYRCGLVGREDQQPGHRDAEVGHRPLDQLDVAELAVVAQVGEVVLGPARALELAGVGQEGAGLAELVEPDVGEGDVLLELGGAADPPAHPLGRDQRVVGRGRGCSRREAGPLEVLDPFGDVVERRVPVDLVGGRVEERVALVGRRGLDVGGPHHPERDALAAAGVEVAGVAQRHLRVGRVQGARVHVGQPAPGPDEDLPERPVARAAVGRAWSRPSGHRLGARGVLGGVGVGRLTHPGALVVGSALVGHPLGVARAVALDHLEELGEVDLAVVVVAGLVVPAQVGVGQREPERLRPAARSCRRTAGAARRWRSA